VRGASRVAVALDLGARSGGWRGELGRVARRVVACTGAGGHGRRRVVVEVVGRHRVARRRWLELRCVHVRGRCPRTCAVVDGDRGDSRGERAQAGACSPSTVQTVRVSLRARAGGAEWRTGSSGGGKENPGLSAAHLVLGGARELVGARRIQIERIPGAVVDLTSGGLVMVVWGSSVRKRHRRGLACF
jgi:hypothetical protein